MAKLLCSLSNTATRPLGSSPSLDPTALVNTLNFIECLTSFTGKSFLCNRGLLEVGGDDEQVNAVGFQVGSTVHACTRGIWIHPKPIMCVDAQTGETFPVYILDTEGLGATKANQTDDAKIFVLAMLLSSLFVYNSSGKYIDM